MFSCKSMQKVNHFIEILSSCIKNNEKNFTKRESNNNKLNLHNFIYSSIQMLRYSSDTVAAEFIINNKVTIRLV